MEHRWGHRIDCDASIGLRSCSGGVDGRLIDGRVVNASISGGLIRSELVLPLHCGLDVFIGNVPVSAFVTRHVGPNTIAVEWCELAHAAVIGLMSKGRNEGMRWHGNLPARPTGASIAYVQLTGTLR